MPKHLIGVMGPGSGAGPLVEQTAYALGEQIARHGWVLLTGGRNVGVMNAASRGAQSAGGLTVGILPTTDITALSSAVDIAILTDLGNARNNVNILSSHVVVACGMGLGTVSEVALALKAGKPVMLMQVAPGVITFFEKLSTHPLAATDSVLTAIAWIESQLRG
ncbi:MAG: TIGR00725 family protein [Leptolyngbyaceae cyanobacterium SM1_1_3]|nr:TIGR00725 family protein [Leptolyngbyaceae cyanobacterium SM1_1_3]NJN03483.1 TIGR00725 family protein [Leptolyngbyaceae cyanobacterium RM1_1_2]NJO09491.1 TIGR00725 family protein [Leptolyngbyaceae cyanobacterium SL_1_1]